MKLLSPIEVSSEKAYAQKRAALDGKALEGRIASLQRALQSEEKLLADFRANAIPQVQKEIALLDSRKRELSEEVQSLEDRKKALLMPISSEIGALEDKRIEIAALQAGIGAQKASLESEWQATDASRSEADSLMERAAKLHSERESLLEIARRERIEASESLRQIGMKALALEGEFARKIALAEERERKAANAERHYRDFEDALRLKERELTLKMRRINHVNRPES